MKNKSNVYECVDIMKFFFAVCIVALHAYAFDWFPRSVYFMIHKGVFRLAVPYFFVASGYFFTLKLPENYKQEGMRCAVNQARNRYCRRILYPFVVFSVINTVQQCISVGMKDGWTLDEAVGIVKHVVFMPYGGMWYLLASIVGIILLAEVVKRDRLHVGLVVGLVLYAFALLCNNYYFIAQKTPLIGLVDGYLNWFVSPRNGVLTGFLFLSMGAKCRDWVGKWSEKQLLCLLIPLYILYIVEFVLLYVIGTARDDGSLYIMQVLVVPMLFLLTCQHKVCMDAARSMLLRNLSTGMYLLHLPILWFLWLVCNWGGINFLIVLPCSIALCMLSYRSKHQWLSTLLR